MGSSVTYDHTPHWVAKIGAPVSSWTRFREAIYALRWVESDGLPSVRDAVARDDILGVIERYAACISRLDVGLQVLSTYGTMYDESDARWRDDVVRASRAAWGILDEIVIAYTLDLRSRISRRR